VDDFVFFVLYVLAAEVPNHTNVDKVPVGADEVGAGVSLKHEKT
jgi:hypothetical protein